MTTDQVNLFMATHSNKFRPEHRQLIYQQLLDLPDEKFLVLQSLSYKDPILFLILSLFLGYLGVDRFVVGDTGLGVLKLITCGGLGIWTIIDWFLIMNRARDANFQLFQQYT